MKNNIQVLTLRGGTEVLNNLSLGIENEIKNISLDKEINSQYNIRFVFENVSKNPSFQDEIFGNKIFEKTLGSFFIREESNVFIKSRNEYLNSIINLNFNSDEYNIGIKVYEDRPINEYTVLKTLPIPTNIITVYIFFYNVKLDLKLKNTSPILKYFDGYSHLGFFLTDLSKMKEIINNIYGVKELDLVHEFSNTDIIDKLFEKEIMMIAWGINPYTYPIYSTDSNNNIKSILGKEFKDEGIFNIDENIKELSLVPGSELKNWPKFLDKDWPKIKLYGKGKKTYLKPYCIEDKDLETVFTSFLIFRKEEELKDAQPLINVDLLYS